MSNDDASHEAPALDGHEKGPEENSPSGVNKDRPLSVNNCNELLNIMDVFIIGYVSILVIAIIRDRIYYGRWIGFGDNDVEGDDGDGF